MAVKLKCGSRIHVHAYTALFQRVSQKQQCGDFLPVTLSGAQCVQLLGSRIELASASIPAHVHTVTLHASTRWSAERRSSRVVMPNCKQISTPSCFIILTRCHARPWKGGALIYVVMPNCKQISIVQWQSSVRAEAEPELNPNPEPKPETTAYHFAMDTAAAVW